MPWPSPRAPPPSCASWTSRPTTSAPAAGWSAARWSSVLLEHRRILLTLGTGILAIAAARGTRTSLRPLWAENIGLSATSTSLVFGIAGALDMHSSSTRPAR